MARTLKKPVGAGLPAMAADQATSILNVPASLLASQLPQGWSCLQKVYFSEESYTFSDRPLHGESASCLLRSNV
jgi:hypothetical protein